jgi:hypothetical protein
MTGIIGSCPKADFRRQTQHKLLSVGTIAAPSLRSKPLADWKSLSIGIRRLLRLGPASETEAQRRMPTQRGTELDPPAHLPMLTITVRHHPARISAPEGKTA